MNKFISTVILAAFTAVFSLGAVAADRSDKDKGGTSKYDSPEDWKKKYGTTGETGTGSTREITKEKTPNDVGPEVKYEYRDQEVMNKKPYKEQK